MTRYNCKFKYMKNDEVVADVNINNYEVTTVKYTDNWLDLPFGKVPDNKVTKQLIDWFFDNHCIPKHKADLEFQLNALGLTEHDSFEICLITQGRMAGTPMWIDFGGYRHGQST